MNYPNLPRFDELPLREGDPPLSAWGLWKDPALGALNYLNDAKVSSTAKEEIRTGERVTLNLPLDAINPGLLGRQTFEHRMIDKNPKIVNDDVITFNTQSSSQWDSFRHFAYQKEELFYNGVTQQDIHSHPESDINSINAWSKHALAGRAFLIDYYDWAQEQGVSYDPLATHAVTISDVKKIMEEKNIQPQQGDIFILRTGYVSAYNKSDPETRHLLSSKFQSSGLGQSRETTKWLWESQFAAVAADCPTFECTPPADPQWALHPTLLAGWGTPIGELFELEALSETCKRMKRWSFFFISVPLKYTGAVASPPNAMAIF
ncbi:hypothetical protein ZTR_00225 [Talaromyces verruculosus]|nr:hypothetical protein ZTR_00225 [Talaromyces verruculosus]